MQGVGFRPFVYRLAGELELGRLRAQRRARRAGRGRGRAGARRRRSSRACAPRRRRWPRVERVLAEAVAPVGERRLRDRRRARAAASPPRSSRPTSRPATDCLAELFDPADRRYRYPFINCTNCGPRFTIVRGVPYDRPHTTMAGFAHVRGLPGRVRGPAPTAASTPSRTPARPAGPRVRCTARRRRRRRRGAAAALLRAGAIVAVKGLGGYHLACRADDERGGGRAARAQAPRGQAVRADGRRPRPRRARWSSSAPPRSALLRSRGAADRARAAAAGRARWPRRSRRARASSGVMLPYTPLHHLLLADAGVPARDDQRQRLRRADRLRRRRRARAAGAASPTLFLRPRPADPHAHRRLGGARRRRGGR